MVPTNQIVRSLLLHITPEEWGGTRSEERVGFGESPRIQIELFSVKGKPLALAMTSRTWKTHNAGASVLAGNSFGISFRVERHCEK